MENQIILLPCKATVVEALRGRINTTIRSLACELGMNEDCYDMFVTNLKRWGSPLYLQRVDEVSLALDICDQSCTYINLNFFMGLSQADLQSLTSGEQFFIKTNPALIL